MTSFVFSDSCRAARSAVTLQVTHLSSIRNHASLA